MKCDFCDFRTTDVLQYVNHLGNVHRDMMPDVMSASQF